MKLLREFCRGEGLNLAGKVISRQAVRAIILNGEQILMVYSPVNHDYKFPGGGVKDGESHADTLSREIREECGLILSEIQGEYGLVVEYAEAREADYDIFKQLSYYYLCSVSPGFLGQELDGYEEELGFRPQWVDLAEALTRNRSVLQGEYGDPPRWTERDTYVLARLAESFAADGGGEK
jgi:8-oxo-dGTP pyrophosphatase MutT (NUDIX family)